MGIIVMNYSNDCVVKNSDDNMVVLLLNKPHHSLKFVSIVIMNVKYFKYLFSIFKPTVFICDNRLWYFQIQRI